jgi:hypothetical protein
VRREDLPRNDGRKETLTADRDRGGAHHRAKAFRELCGKIGVDPAVYLRDDSCAAFVTRSGSAEVNPGSNFYLRRISIPAIAASASHLRRAFRHQRPGSNRTGPQSMPQSFERISPPAGSPPKSISTWTQRRARSSSRIAAGMSPALECGDPRG